MTDQDLEDLLAEAIDDTLDVDWTGRVAARALVPLLKQHFVPRVEGPHDALIERLKAKTKRGLPADWQKERLCPECDAAADRPKCMWEMGGNCPRHDPDNYKPSPYVVTVDPLCTEAATALASLQAELAEKEREIERLQVAWMRGRWSAKGWLRPMVRWSSLITERPLPEPCWRSLLEGLVRQARAEIRA